jgi:serine/threonine protein kinase
MDFIKTKGPLPPEFLYRFCHQAASGLAYCHSQGISHGDIKPDNILLDLHQRCKLADFGLGQQVDPAVASTQFVGSLAFMAPEVLVRRAFDPFIADIWSLGITFYWMGRGASPFRLTDAATLLRSTQCGLPANASAHMPHQFVRLLRQMVEPNPELRIPLADVIPQLVVMAEAARVPLSRKIDHSESTNLIPKLAGARGVSQPGPHVLAGSKSAILKSVISGFKGQAPWASPLKRTAPKANQSFSDCGEGT